MTHHETGAARRQDAFVLDGLSFLLADVQDNLGVFLAGLLATYGWSADATGVAISAGGAGAVLARLFGGRALDSLSRRRIMLGACCVLTACAVAVAAVSPGFWQVTLVHCLAGGAGALFSPILAAISRQTAGARGYVARMGRNESFNHLGNALIACLMGVAGSTVAPVAPLWAISGLATVALVLALLLSSRADQPPAPASVGDEAGGGPEHRALFTFLLCYFLFNLANGAMVPLMIERHAAFHFGSASAMSAICIIVAQATMVPVAYVIGRSADTRRRKPLFLLALALQPLRDLLMTASAGWPTIVAAQMLDGLSSGIVLVLFFAGLSDLSRGGGRPNTLIGIGLAAGTVGALLSNVGSGLLTTYFGFNTAFLALSVCGCAVFALYLLAMPETHELETPVPKARPA
ncbi:major facilitator superfamily transporter [Ameyamaea chiangmaiensis NBRC 103196]|uniref:MFS transporter n=1 Tax=Ameyamaea chiangmaiensis TaxID=442969 RepID=A0A850PG84_9PROT|nr:MFS transporter [Ameyamaea chiangmaiensis]MBS4075922.1 MFS transporter [Ameyamaea chiangmaiensis]NVN40171.1 MFS transporter [Ameyamaea chiangmaiensis]GBQ61725.1 major facilitator superfamily transporter [Ameyamaea chiangmaiensis NBRC 103196]